MQPTTHDNNKYSRSVPVIFSQTYRMVSDNKQISAKVRRAKYCPDNCCVEDGLTQGDLANRCYLPMEHFAVAAVFCPGTIHISSHFHRTKSHSDTNIIHQVRK